MLHYILYGITLYTLIFFAYIKLKYPFWNNQPVYHTYDFIRGFYSVPFCVNKHVPAKTKYYDPSHIQTNQYVTLKETTKKQIIDMMQCYYINTDRIIHTINSNDLHAYLTGQSELSQVSIYFEHQYEHTFDLSLGSQLLRKYKPLGCVTSRKLNFWHINKNNASQNYTELPIYFIDYLCVSRCNEMTIIYRKLIQTHEYHQRIETPNINCSLIKKEIELFHGIVPLVEYDTYTYKLRNHAIPKLPKYYHVIQLTSDNLDIYTDFFYTNNDYCSKTKLYDILIFPDVGNILEMLKNKLIHIYCLKAKEHIYGFYFFKDAKMYYEDVETNTLQCINSVMNCLSTEIFYAGYMNSLREIIRKDTSFTMLLFEDIGHNHILFQFWNKKYSPIFKNKTAYYLYNYIYPGSPLNKSRIFVLN